MYGVASSLEFRDARCWDPVSNIGGDFLVVQGTTAPVCHQTRYRYLFKRRSVVPCGQGNPRADRRARRRPLDLIDEPVQVVRVLLFVAVGKDIGAVEPLDKTGSVSAHRIEHPEVFHVIQRLGSEITAVSGGRSGATLDEADALDPVWFEPIEVLQNHFAAHRPCDDTEQSRGSSILIFPKSPRRIGAE